MKKPNILIIVVDSMRADHLSCYGYDRPTTPNIDRLAEEGCLFENAITAAPFSPASYASIFSNLYPHQHGVNGDTVRIWPDTWPRLPERMRENGYYTFCVSDNPFVSNEMNGTRGFDAFVNQRERWMIKQYKQLNRRIRKYLGDRVAKRLDLNLLFHLAKSDSRKSIGKAIALIRDGRRPFFGTVILMDPHAPYDFRRRKFCGNRRQVRAFLRGVNDPNMWLKTMVRRQGLPPELHKVAIDLYDGEVFHADHCVGVIHDWLRSAGLLEETLLIVTADHGEAFGEHGVWGHGFCLNDCLTRVPLITRCPRYWQAGLRSKPLVQLHDLHDLCLSVAGNGSPRVKKHPHCLTQVADPCWSGREIVFSEFPVQTGTLAHMNRMAPEFSPNKWAQPMWAVRSRQWRYVEYGPSRAELFEFGNDGNEHQVDSTSYPEVCRELAAVLAEHRSSSPYIDPAKEPATEESLKDSVMDRLRALGYLE